MRIRPYPLLFFLLACNPAPAPESLSDSDYFPLQTGRFRVYTVTEQVYRVGQPATTRQYAWRETVGVPFRTLAGDTAYVLSYAHQAGNGLAWEVDSMGTAQRTPVECLGKTGGQTVVKLAFPLFDGQRWNGNRYNASGPDEFRLQRCHQPFRTSTKTFDRTVTVIGQNDSTLVSQDKRVEVYAYEVGLVYAERQQLRFCATDPGCGQPAAIAHGIRQFIRLTEYGKE